MFDEFKIKRLLKKNITKEMYESLSDKIKHDNRVVKRFVESNPQNIGYLDPNTSFIEYVLNDYSLILYLNQLQLSNLFSKHVNQLDISKLVINEKTFNSLKESQRIVLFKLKPELCYSFFNDLDNIRLLYSILSANINNSTEDEYYGLLSNRDIAEIINNLNGESIFILLRGSEKIKDFIWDIYREMTIDKLYFLYREVPSLLENMPEECKTAIINKDMQNKTYIPSTLDEELEHVHLR